MFRIDLTKASNKPTFNKPSKPSVNANEIGGFEVYREGRYWYAMRLTDERIKYSALTKAQVLDMIQRDN